MAMQKQDESLLEDIWTLLRAGRLEKACDLCRSAGQVIKLLEFELTEISNCGFPFLFLMRASILGSHGELPLYVHLEDLTLFLLLKPW